MQKKNYQRMFELIDQSFQTRSDPDQLQVNEEQMQKLQLLHPACLSEMSTEDGPVIWVLMFPTQSGLMKSFLLGTLSERALLEQTPINASCDCLYLCSATTLPEYRVQGKTFSLCVKAAHEIISAYPIKTLFTWPFSVGGEKLAEKLAQNLALPLELRK